MDCLNVDRHHIAHERKWYTSTLDKHYRNHSILKVRMDRGAHEDLHANVPPPPKPNKEIIIGSMAMLFSLEDEPDQVEAIKRYADYLETYRGRSTELAHALGENITAQLVYIEAGIVVPELALIVPERLAA